MRVTNGRTVGLPLLLTGLLLGCSGSERSEFEAPSWQLEEVGRFGSFEGQGSALSEVADIALTDSTILILESSPPRVAVFGYDGTWLRDLGRAGDGPGEFRTPLELGVFEGNVWVGDLNGLRLEVLAQDGSSVGSYRWDIPRDSLDDLAVPTAILEDGSVLASPRRIISPSIRSRPYYRVSTSGEVLGTLYRQPIAEGDVFTASLPGRGLAIGPHPLPQSPVVDVLPSGRGLVIVERPQASQPETASFNIKVVGADGTQSHQIEVSYAPISAEGWLDDFTRRSEQEEMQRTGSVNREMLTAIRESFGPRSFYPPVSDVVGGSDGSIWVRREEFLLADSVRWQVFDAEGDMVGTFSASKDLRILLPSLEEVWAVEPGEYDVPFVVRLSIGRPS
jgi:hypothetical protein